MNAEKLGLTPPNITFDDNGAVRNRDYGDIYFSPEDGRAESSFVFLENNNLAERFAALGPDDVFTIGELGFGTGLNFLLAWELFDKHAPDGARLCFMSCELHPMDGDQIRRAMQPYPELVGRAGELARKMPPPVRGTHTLFFDAGRVRLTLLLGKASETLPDAHAHVDAWFLDGFAPAKNAEIWAEYVIGHLARLSRSGTSFATFTAAGAVRRALASHGFAVKKIPGYGRKRDMVAGTMTADKVNAAHNQIAPPHSGPGKAIVIGTGIAGACAAHALAIRGWQVTVLDKRPPPDTDAPVIEHLRGATYPKLGAEASPATRTLLSGFNFTKQLLDLNSNSGHLSCGVLALDFSDARRKKHDGIAGLGLPETLARRLDTAGTQAVSGLSTGMGGLYMPTGGTIQPLVFCGKLLSHTNIHMRYECEAHEIKRENEEWHVHAASGKHLASAPVLIIAAGPSINAMAQLSWIAAEKIRGQITLAPATPKSRAIKCVLNHKGYVLPAHQDIHVIGSTFDKSRDAPNILDEDNITNLTTLAKHIPALADEFPPEKAADMDALAGVRVAVNDRLPMAGPCPDYDSFVTAYEGLSYGKDVDSPAPLYPGLFVTGAHGSHGLSTAPLCGELIAAMLAGDPLPIEMSLYEYVMPARMILRGLKRGEISLAG